MQVERIEEVRLSADEDAQINRLLLAAFDDSFGARSFYQQRHHVRLVVRDAGVIIGHMAICYRAVRLGEMLTTIAGLAEVAVNPAYQGRGIAGQLLSAAIEEVKNTQAKFFVLFGNRPIYAGRGFVEKQNTVTYVDMTAAHTVAVKTTSDAELMIMEMSATPWDNHGVLDLLGHNF